MTHCPLTKTRLTRHLERGDARLSVNATPQCVGTLAGLTLRQAEKVLIECALERADRNVRRAARVLGVSRSALYRKLQRHCLAASQVGAR